MVQNSGLLVEAIPRLIAFRDKERYEGNLLDFAEYVWPVVEPDIPFTRGWALDAVGEHLAAVARGEIKRLFINIPPGCTKSLLTDVFFPAWVWGPQGQASKRFLCFSYSSYLTERDNMRCRAVVQSQRYQKLWGDRVTLSSEQFTKVKFANIQTGWKLATSVGGVGVGERGDYVIIDDPNDTMDMESEAMRRTAQMWFTEVIPSRLNNPSQSRIIVIQQRLHEEDISGTIMSREMGYTHLCVPMEYEKERYVNGWDGGEVKTFKGEAADEFVRSHPDKIFWRDPRTYDGELLWPERFPADVVVKFKRESTAVAYAGQFQQRPEPRGGTIIKRDYWQLWKEERYPEVEFILASLDTAYTEKETNDPSALTVWGVFRDAAGNPKIILMYAWREYLDFHSLIQKVLDTCTKDERKLLDADGRKVPRFNVDRLLIESKASGISVAQEMVRLYAYSGRFGIELVDPKKYGDKVSRVYSIEHMFAHKMIFAPDKTFADKVIDEMVVFPNAKYDDLTDSTSMALRYLRNMGLALHTDEQSMVTAQETAYQGQRASQPLYPV